MNKKTILIVALVCMMVQGAWAQTEVGTEEALKSAVANGGSVQLTGDITLSSRLNIVGGKTVSIDLNGLTLKRTMEAAADDGNVIYVSEGATLTVSDGGGSGQITGGWAKEGGGIYNAGTLIINGGSVTGNKASSQGGGIWSKGTLTINGGSVSHNEAPSTGGINNTGTMTMKGGTVTGNKSTTWGGGGIANHSTLTMTGGTITDNETATDGGGLWNEGTLTMTNVTVSSNKARDAAGIWNEGTINITGCTVRNNVTSVAGAGGIANQRNATLNIDGCTITGNTGQLDGCGLWSAGTLSMKGAVNISGNHDGSGADDNLFLDGQTVINVTGALTGSNIGVNLAQTRAFTSGYKANNPQTAAEAFFSSDVTTYAVAQEGQEALLGRSVTFYERSWDETNKKVVSTQTTKLAKELTGSHGSDWLGLGSSNDQDDHYYVVTGNTSYQTLNCFGRVHLILADGATLTCTGGIKLDESNNNAKLFIYSQSDGDNEGRLVVTNSYSGAAGIGSSEGTQCGDIEIHGGNLDITGGKEAAGIGAGLCTETVGTGVDFIIIYSGTVKVQGGKYGAGIGGGGSSYNSSNVSHGAKFRLYGGYVTATGGTNAAGIGGGSNYDAFEELPGGGSGDCRIYGGTLTAQGGHRGAGIGGGSTKHRKGYKTNNGSVYIEGGTVNATGGKYGAGIGGGCNMTGGTITIAGGTVTAIGGVDGAGIGGGEDGAGGTVTISGGTVRAEGRSYGAGIGGGDFDRGTNSEIDAGNTENSIGANVTITGGTVIAIAGDDCKARKAEGGSAIGAGEGMSNKDDSFRAQPLNLPDNYKVTGGDSETSIDAVFTSDARVAACRWRNYVKIEPCPHTTPLVGGDRSEAITYSVDDEYHTMHCRYCNYTLQEVHSGTACVCGKTSVYRFTVYEPGTEKNTYVEGATIAVGVGQEFYLPACQTIPEGYTFKGWEMNPNTLEPDYTNWAAVLSGDPGMDSNMPAGTSVKALLGQTPAQFYARFLYVFESAWTWAEDGSSASVTLSHNDLDDVTLASTDNKVTIGSEALKDEADNTIGTRYTATCTYTLNGYDYTFTSEKDVLAPAPEPTPQTVELEIKDGEDNSQLLNEYIGQVANVTMPRTFWKDGAWNTLCLPFAVDDLSATPLAGATVKTLASSSFTGGTLTLNFTDASSISAGQPYIVKWPSGDDLVNPRFEGVTISDTQGSTVGSAYVDFVGSFAPFAFTAGDNSTLYLGTDNKLYYPTTARTMGACRAYFQLHNGLTVGELKAEGARIVLNFGDDETTAISTTNFTNDTNEASAWYDLQGRKYSERPTAKGIYIKNGNKRVIK